MNGYSFFSSRYSLGLLVAITGLFLIPLPAGATFTGQCSSCHTMHNSQNGATVTDWSSWGEGGGPAFLLAASCIGCHTGDNTSSSVALTNDTDAPYVLGSTAPTYNNTGTGTGSNTLAGGNFYWVVNATTNKDRKGHNVTGIVAQDATLGLTPPGGTAMTQQLRCAGAYGCHGDRSIADPYLAMEGVHHGKAMSTNFRALENTDGTAIAGLEDADWEFQATDGNTSHNQYKGTSRTTDTDEDTSTISSFCASCHGDFHYGAGTAGIDADAAWGSPWLRHPVDYQLPASGEYSSYNTTNDYSVVSPVASQTVTSALATVTPGTTNTIVMCLSCHRAHGTPYDSILRWDYKSWPGGGYNGCAICHTAKN